MALVTYMLLFSFARGLQSKFKPEVLGESLTKAIAVVMLEFIEIKLGCYFLDVRDSGGASGVEILAYGGYKFVGIIATIIASMLDFGMVVNWGVFFYTFCANAFFLVSRCMRLSSNISAPLAQIRPPPRPQRVWRQRGRDSLASPALPARAVLVRRRHDAGHLDVVAQQAVDRKYHERPIACIHMTDIAITSMLQWREIPSATSPPTSVFRHVAISPPSHQDSENGRKSRR